MTITSETNRSGPYNGNGVTTVFDYGFRVIEAEHITVIKADIDGNETVLILDSDYSVSGVGASVGGSIQTAAAPAVGETITLLLDVPFTQEIDLENQGAYFAETVEKAFDLSVQRDLVIQEQFSRSILLSRSSASSDIEIDDPGAGEWLRYSADGTRLESSPVITPDGSYPIATQSEAIDGARNDVLMTALRVRQHITGNTATQEQALAGADNETIMTPLRVSQVISASFAPPDDEAGVVNDTFPVGDVRRYGIKLDCEKAEVNTTNGSAVITAPAGTFTSRVAGMSVVDTTSTSTNYIPDGATIVSVAVDGSSLTLSAAATGSDTRTVLSGTDAFASTSVTHALRDNGLNPNITLFFPRGDIISSFNFGADFSGTKERPWKAHFDHTVIHALIHFVDGVSNMELSGTVYTHDRFGITAGLVIGGCSVVSGSETWTAAAGTFSNTPVGSTIINSAIRTGRGVIVSKATDGSSITLDNEATTTSGPGNVDLRSTNIRVENVFMLHDLTGNAASPGEGGRGLHVVEVCGFYFNRLVAIDCSPTYVVGGVLQGSLAAMSFEQSSNGRDIVGNEILVVNSGTHGVVVNGYGWDVKSIKVLGCVRSVGIDYNTGGGHAGFPNETESENGCGVFFGRWGGKIGSVWVSQSNKQPSGAYTNPVKFHDNGVSTSADTTNETGIIDHLYAEVGAVSGAGAAGVQMGIPGYTIRMNVAIGTMTLKLNSGWLLASSGTPMLSIPAALGGFTNRIAIGQLNFINPQGYACLSTGCDSAETKLLTIDNIEVLGATVGQNFLDVRGHSTGDLQVHIRKMNLQYPSGSYIANSMCFFYKVNKLILNGIEVGAGAAVQNSAMHIELCGSVSLSNVVTRNLRGAELQGIIRLSGNTRALLQNVQLLSPDVSGTGIYFIGSCALVSFYNVLVDKCAVGTAKAVGATFALNSSMNSFCTNSTAKSSLVTADFVAAAKINQDLVT